jgi:hypothetical protein
MKSDVGSSRSKKLFFNDGILIITVVFSYSQCVICPLLSLKVISEMMITIKKIDENATCYQRLFSEAGHKVIRIDCGVDEAFG